MDVYKPRKHIKHMLSDAPHTTPGLYTCCRKHIYARRAGLSRESVVPPSPSAPTALTAAHTHHHGTDHTPAGAGPARTPAGR